MRRITKASVLVVRDEQHAVAGGDAPDPEIPAAAPVPEPAPAASEPAADVPHSLQDEVLARGYKLTKYLTRMTFSAERHGGCWEDRGYPWFAGFAGI